MSYPVLAQGSTWYKSSVLRSTYTQIDIVDSYTPTGSEDEVWNADSGNAGEIKCYREGTVLTIAGNGSGKIAMNADSSYLFCDSSLTSAASMFINVELISGLDLLDASNAATLRGAFAYCSKLASVDLSSWDVGKVETMRYLFGSTISYFQIASGFTNINLTGWITSACTDMSYMFHDCDKLTSITGIDKFDVSNVTYFDHIFAGCTNLAALNLSNWNFKRATNLNSFFMGCSALTELDVSGWDVSNITDMGGMFNGCSSISALGVSGWNVSRVTNMQFMFNKCFALRYLDVSRWDVSSVTNMSSMFSGTNYGVQCVPIEELDVSNWDVSSVTNMGWAFYGMRKLKKLNVSKWNVSNVEIFHHTFAWCTNLVIEGLENWNPTSAQTMNAMFHGNATTNYDLKGWSVSNVENFAQMFERNTKATNIQFGNWDTSNGKAFAEMFSGCQSLIKLDVSSFDTRNADDAYIDPIRGSAVTNAMANMFGQKTYKEDGSVEPWSWMYSLAEIKLGVNFSLDGEGKCEVPAVLPEINTEVFPDADGKWYDAAGAGYSVNGVPNLTASTYYATANLSAKAGEERVTVKTRTLVGTANAIRESKYVGNFRPSEFAAEIRTVTDKMAYYREKAEGKGMVMREFLHKNPRYFSDYTSDTYTLSNAVGAEFKDGFSVIVTGLCMNSKTFDYNSMKDYGLVVFRDVNGIYKDAVPTVSDILNNDDAIVYTKDTVELGTIVGYNSYNCVLRPVWADEADVVHYILAYMVDMSGKVHVRDTVYYQSNGYDISVRGMCEIFKSNGTAENQNLYKTAISFFDAYNAYFV